MSLRRWIAQKLCPEVFERAERFENYKRLVDATRDANSFLGYDYPSIRVVTAWILAHVPNLCGPSIELLHDSLVKDVGEEADELAQSIAKRLSEHREHHENQ